MEITPRIGNSNMKRAQAAIIAYRKGWLDGELNHGLVQCINFWIARRKYPLGDLAIHILEKAEQGLNDAQIREELNTTPATVIDAWFKIRKVLKVKQVRQEGRQEAVGLAGKRGLLNLVRSGNRDPETRKQTLAYARELFEFRTKTASDSDSKRVPLERFLKVKTEVKKDRSKIDAIEELGGIEGGMVSQVEQDAAREQLRVIRA
jgi:hypothetical protein